jgi:hypothetical protein
MGREGDWVGQRVGGKMRLRGRRRISFIPTCLPPVAALRGWWGTRRRPPITTSLVLCELLGDFIGFPKLYCCVSLWRGWILFKPSSWPFIRFSPMNLAVAVALLFFPVIWMRRWPQAQEGPSHRVLVLCWPIHYCAIEIRVHTLQ